MEESSLKRVGDELEQENAKKQKVDNDQETAKMKELMKIVPDKEKAAVDAMHLATKPLSIVDWKIVKEGKTSYYQIIRADGSSRRARGVTEEPRKEGGDSNNDQEKEDDNVNNTNNVNTASDGNNTNNINVVSSTVNAARHKLTTAKES
ncbi:hypothetical protein Tco_0802122 [Tanacetum coccineum]|uniref:Uncharacterized protein n=1 Tax=Tanacetum coccineum TaxID=301880 RepID=A0ABQ4ZXY7_9ASTR